MVVAKKVQVSQTDSKVQSSGWWSGAVAVAEHALVHLAVHPGHLRSGGGGGERGGGVVERFDFLGDGEVLLGDGPVGDLGVAQGPIRSGAYPPY